MPQRPHRPAASVLSAPAQRPWQPLVAALGLAALAMAAPFRPVAAEEPQVVTVKRLSLGTALKVAQGAVAACHGKGIQVAATVVDRDGVVQAQLRDTIAAPITVPISFKKAYTAANFNADTSALADRADTPIGRQDFLVMSGGGVVIHGGGALLGAVGVSGAPSGETDEECARAGVATVQEELDLAM